MKKQRTLFQTLFTLFLGGVALLLFLFSFVTLTLTENRFDTYLTERMASERDTLIQELEAAYLENDEWNEDTLEAMNWGGMQAQVLFTLYSPAGEEIYDQTESMMNGRGMGMMQGSNRLATSEDWLEEEIPLTVDGETIGTVALRYPGVINYSQEEEQFLDDLLFILVGMSVVALGIAGIVAYQMSKRISQPLIETSRITQSIADGHYEQRLAENESIRELAVLKENVNQLAEQLALQKAIRNQLTSDLAHEVRTPLTTLQGTIEAMIDGVWEVTPDRLAILNREVQRLARLIQTIDQLDDVEQEREALQLEATDLFELAKKTVELFSIQAEQKGVQLTATGPPVTVPGDADKLSQVLTNLVNNALKFTGSGGKIQVAVVDKASEVQVQVTDTGVGINPSDQKKIFERFYQSDPSRNSTQEGQGIGLAVAQSIVLAHGGRITVESQEGKGATFTVTLSKK
ncbi:sensor histidine kinase [Lacticigenium naphthae]|uniref:sensor histidine kinase n=1 Tax=Lacticigenium naphthae TaxID=515351 RepID=UPI0003FC9205|nr:HAMP domain-containing sensor histidine kinase [Lacticigenium naphthae]